MTDGRQALLDRLVAERFAPPIRQAPTTTLGTARLLTASAESGPGQLRGLRRPRLPRLPVPNLP